MNGGLHLALSSLAAGPVLAGGVAGEGEICLAGAVARGVVPTTGGPASRTRGAARGRESTETTSRASFAVGAVEGALGATVAGATIVEDEGYGAGSVVGLGAFVPVRVATSPATTRAAAITPAAAAYMDRTRVAGDRAATPAIVEAAGAATGCVTS